MAEEERVDPNVARERRKNPFRTVAVVILVDGEGKFLLVRTKRLPNEWQPIGGGVKSRDRSVSEAALREVNEETGLVLKAEALQPIFETEYDFGEGRVHFFRASLPTGAGLRMQTEELEESSWFTLQEAERLQMFPATRKCLDFLKHGRQTTGRESDPELGG